MRFSKSYLLFSALFISSHSFAAISSNSSQLEKELQIVTARTEKLQKQVDFLNLKLHEKKSYSTVATTKGRSSAPTPYDAEVPVHYGKGRPKNVEENGFGPARFSIHGITVTTYPFLGLNSAYDASDVLSQYPTMNEDLLILQQRQGLEKSLETVGDSLNNRPIIGISGSLEGQIYYFSHNNGFMGNSTYSADLSTAEIDIAAMVSAWANGYISLDYDNSPPETGSRVTNSRIYLQRGFLTIGNLDVTPVYLTVGQMYMPFGKYSSAMLTTPLTKSMARIEDRAILLGYYNNGLYASAYVFRGNRAPSRDNSGFLQEGVNLGYGNKAPWGTYDFGTGYVTNIADSQGMQGNGLGPLFSNGLPTQFTGFGGLTLDSTGAATVSSDRLEHNVPAVDAHAQIGFSNHITLIGEFVTTTRPFAGQDMTYGAVGARPMALHSEADYTWTINNKAVTFGLAYGQTWQALALNLPKNSYAAVLSSSIWKNTIESIEYRYDVNYPAGVTASGAMLPSPAPVVVGMALPEGASVGGHRSIVTAQVGVYF